MTVGQMVRLRTGGPKMTVVWTGTNGRACVCKWFTADDQLHEGRFEAETLVVVEEA